MPLLRTLRVRRKHAPVDATSDHQTAVVLAKLDAAVERFRNQIDRIERIERQDGDDDDG